MFNEIIRIADFILTGIIHIWPYLLITIPLSVLIRLTGKFRNVERLLGNKPLVSIFIATLIGALSPFCSCGIIPVIASLLLSGVPLAPVMAFWLASPSMDPEMFFLSASILGWDLAVWRLLSTFIMSLSGGYITYLLQKKGMLSGEILRKGLKTSYMQIRIPDSLRSVLEKFRKSFSVIKPVLQTEAAGGSNSVACCMEEIKPAFQGCSCGSAEIVLNETKTIANSCCRDSNEKIIITDSCCTVPDSSSREEEKLSSRLLRETVSSTLMVAKFMVIAFFLEALIEFYVPQMLIIRYLGAQNQFSILLSAIAGIPVYTSNITALPLIGALVKDGMTPAAALAFLISGPTTTIPAMAAVWKLAERRVFFLYVAYTLISSMVMGYLFYYLN